MGHCASWQRQCKPILNHYKYNGFNIPQRYTQEKEGLGGSGRNMDHTVMPFPYLKTDMSLDFTWQNL